MSGTTSTADTQAGAAPDAARDLFVSVVTVLDENAPALTDFLRGMAAQLSRHYSDHELLVIAQRPGDVGPDIELLLEELPRIRIVTLARPVQQDVALGAGLENAIGDFVVLAEPGHDPPRAVIAAVEMCRQGSHVVVGCAPQPRTLAYALCRPLIDAVVARVLQRRPPANETRLRCLSRAAANAIMESNRFHHQLYLRMHETGYPIEALQYEGAEGAHAAKRTLRGEFRRAVHLVVFGSTAPLRIMSALGVLGSFMAFVFAAYSLVIRFFKEAVIEGWTTTVLFMSVPFMLLFMILAFFGEYLGRLLDDDQRQRHYNVASERTSNVMVDETRPNVSDKAAASLRPPPADGTTGGTGG